MTPLTAALQEFLDVVADESGITWLVDRLDAALKRHPSMYAWFGRPLRCRVGLHHDSAYADVTETLVTRAKWCSRCHRVHIEFDRASVEGA